MPLNIRWRLTLWNTAALAVVLTAFAAMIYYVLAREHFERIDRGLGREFHELAEHPDWLADADKLDDWIADLRRDDNIACAIYGPDGAVAARTKDPPEEVFVPAPAGAAGPALRDVASPGGRLRVLDGRVRLASRDYTAVLAAPLKEVDEEMNHFLTAIVVVLPFALLATGLCGYFLAGRALAPMERLRKRTEEITAARLDRRLPVANPHDELGRLAGTINDMIARLERSFGEIRRFTADASHELRTPLAAIRMESEVALGRPLGEEGARNLLGSILEEVERLSRLTDQLLALAREDAGAAPRPAGKVDLAGLAAGVVETMRPLAESRGVVLTAETDGPAEVRGDGARLRQVLYNLLDNAIKYTPEGGAIAVRCGRGGGEAFVAVRDTGVGIAPEHLPRVFDRFYRVDRARSREEGGTGLGLSIAKSIVAAHGGRVEVESAPGKGTTFTIRLPEGHEAPNTEGGPP